MKMKVKVRHVILSLVCLVLGFILAFSYSLANSEKKEGAQLTDGQWQREDKLRSQLFSLQEKILLFKQKYMRNSRNSLTLKRIYPRRSRFTSILQRMQKSTGCFLEK